MLAATTDILLALFTPWPTISHPDIPLYNLEDLTIIKTRARPSNPTPQEPNYDDINRVLLYAPGSREPGKVSRISLQSITIELPYEVVAVGKWLESASPSNDCSTERPDGLALSAMKSAVRVASAFMLPMGPTPPPRLATALASLTQISSLTLKIRRQEQFYIRLHGARPTFAFHPQTVSNFVAGLPAVREVVLDELFGCPRKAVRDADEFWGGIGSMREKCGMLDKIEIRGFGRFVEPVIWYTEDDEPAYGFAAWAPAFHETNG